MESENTPTKWKLEYWMNKVKYTRTFRSKDLARNYARSLGPHISKFVVRPIENKNKTEKQTETPQE